MQQTQSQIDADLPVAPQEIRELLTRLTEASVESIPATEARTLGGLALETGIPIDRLRSALGEIRGERSPLKWPIPVALIAAVLAIGGWLLRPTPPVQAPPQIGPFATPAGTGNLSGLVPLDQVTFGPDSGSFQVDTSFSPTAPLQPGVSISATVGNVMWGSGDHRAAALQGPLTAEEEERLRKSLTELLGHVRERATRRELPTTPLPGQVLGKGYVVQFTIQTYFGTTGGSVTLPASGTDDEIANNSIRDAVDKAAKTLQEQLRWTASNRRERGP